MLTQGGEFAKSDSLSEIDDALIGATKASRSIKMEKVLPLLLLPNIAFAGGGGGFVLVILFLPVLVWAFVKIWTFWFRLIFGGSDRGFVQQRAGTSPLTEANSQPAPQPTRECPDCAEIILAKARKCKHCGSNVAPAAGSLASGPASS